MDRAGPWRATLMRAARLLAALAVVCATTGMECHRTVRPRERPITGVVRYREAGGEPVSTAKVRIAGTADSVFSDTLGRYSIQAPAGADTVTLEARDGYAPGTVYVVISSGSVRITVGPHGATTDIVLDKQTPI